MTPDLRQELRERLRLVAEFATLGAYELAEPPHQDAPHAPGGEPTQRVFLFARAGATHCKGGREAVKQCPARAPERLPRQGRRAVRRGLVGRRPGAEAAVQPCTWASEPTPHLRRDR